MFQEFFYFSETHILKINVLKFNFNNYLLVFKKQIKILNIILGCMTYLFLYVIGLILIWYVYRVGWFEALKTSLSVIIPSFLIILFNLKAGRLLFKNPILGLISVLPTSVFIFRSSKPLVSAINNWLENKINKTEIKTEVIETEAVPLDE